jgi:hypothetical protein
MSAGSPLQAADAIAALEAGLLESRRRLQQLQRVASLGFWDWDLIAQQIFVSEEVYRICGIPQKSGTYAWCGPMERSAGSIPQPKSRATRRAIRSACSARCSTSRTANTVKKSCARASSACDFYTI